MHSAIRWFKCKLKPPKKTKSSYVNARGTPTAAYQVLHLLFCVRGGTPAVEGTPCQGSYHGVPPVWTWLGYLPHLDLAGGTPPPLARWGTPCGQTDGWMDRHVSKHYLPVVLRTRSVTIKKFIPATM